MAAPDAFAIKEVATPWSLTMIVLFSLVGCSKGAAECRGTPLAAAACRTSDADLAPDGGDGGDAGDDEGALEVTSPIRFHLRNDGPVEVYLGLRFIDRCAFDYTVSKLAPGDGGADVTIESPMCRCRPSCTECSATCAPASCYELCDETPPRIVPGQERLLTWDGQRFDFVVLCPGRRCAAASAAAPGRYRLTVPIFDSAAQQASRGGPAGTPSVSFDLRGASAAGTDVELSIRLP
jgi:hypothetical protein